MSDPFVTPGTEARQAPLFADFPARILEWVAISYSGETPDPGFKSGLLHWQEGFFFFFFFFNQKATREAQAYFTDKETEAQRDEGSCPKSQSW